MTSALSSEPRMHRLAAVERRASRRAGSGASGSESARKRTQPSWAISQAERSVTSGAARESPMKGRRTKVPRLAILSPDGVCDRLLSTPSREVVVRRVVLVRANAGVDESAPAVHVLRSLLEPPAFPGVAARGLVRAVELVREDLLRHVHVDTAERVDQLAEPVEVEDDDVMDRQAGQRSHGRDRERRPADLVRGVDLPRAVARDVDAEIAGDRQVRQPVLAGIGAQQQERVGASRVAWRPGAFPPSVPITRIVAGFEKSDPSDLRGGLRRGAEGAGSPRRLRSRTRDSRALPRRR